MWLDYARVIVSALWKRLDQESIVKNKDKVYFFLWANCVPVSEWNGSSGGCNQALSS